MSKLVEKINPAQREFLLGLKPDGIRAWALATKIPYNSMYRFIEGQSYLTVANLEKVCKEAGVTIDKFRKIGSVTKQK